MRTFLIGLIAALFIVLVVVSGYTYLAMKATPDYAEQVHSIVLEPGQAIVENSSGGIAKSESLIVALSFTIAEKKMGTLRPPPLLILEHYRVTGILNRCRFAFADWNSSSTEANKCLSDFTDLLEKYST